MSAPADYFSFGALAATAPVVIASAGVVMSASRFSFGAAPSSPVMSLPNKGAEAKAVMSTMAFSFGVTSLQSSTTPAHHGR